MSIESLLTELMIDTITLAAVSSKDAYGKRTWGTPASITNCRVQNGSHKVLDLSGQETVAVGKVYVPGSPTLTLNTKLVLPDGSSPPILAVDRFADERGSHHTCIHYGK
jgi:hypothetical protein